MLIVLICLKHDDDGEIVLEPPVGEDAQITDTQSTDDTEVSCNLGSFAI